MATAGTAMSLWSELQSGQPDAPATGMTEVDDLSTFDLGPGLQLVRLAEEIGSVHRLDLVDPIRGRIVVVGDS